MGIEHNETVNELAKEAIVNGQITMELQMSLGILCHQ